MATTTSGGGGTKKKAAAPKRSRGNGGGTSVSPFGKQAALNGTGRKSPAGTSVSPLGKQAALNAGQGIGAPTGNNGFIAGAKVSPLYNFPSYMKQTPATKASQEKQSAIDAAATSNGSNDPLLQALLSAASSTGGAQSGTFSGKLSDYISQAEKAIPGVSYASQVSAVKKNAARGQKDLGSMYSALAAYTAGQRPVVEQQYADSANDLKSSSNAAAALANGMYASLQGNAAQGAGSVAEGARASAAVGQNAATDQNAAHKDAVAGALAQGLQNSLVNNISQKGAALGWINNSGNAAQLGGAQAKTDLTKALTTQLAEYATLQAQADQQRAAQALQLGQSEFNSDRSYAQQAAAAAAAGQNDQFDRLLKLKQLQDAEAAAAKPKDTSAADTANAIKVQGNQTSYINAFMQQFGRLPTRQELAQAGF